MKRHLAPDVSTTNIIHTCVCVAIFSNRKIRPGQNMQFKPERVTVSPHCENQLVPNHRALLKVNPCFVSWQAAVAHHSQLTFGSRDPYLTYLPPGFESDYLRSSLPDLFFRKFVSTFADRLSFDVPALLPAQFAQLSCLKSVEDRSLGVVIVVRLHFSAVINVPGHVLRRATRSVFVIYRMLLIFYFFLSTCVSYNIMISNL